MNYTGGKYKTLEYILPHFPNNIQNFVDLFAGGLNVCLNAEAKKIYANDQISYMMEMYEFFCNTETDELLALIKKRILEFDLSKTNEDGYKKLRAEYNRHKTPLDLFVLTCYSFNNQIRFNNRHEFNISFGKGRSSFNKSIEDNLVKFCNALHNKDVVFSSLDFRDFDLRLIGKDDFLYCDPPYLISNGPYNDGKRGFKNWDAEDDMDLMSMLDQVDSSGGRFLLSNVFYHKGVANEPLMKWSEKYNVRRVFNDYSNCNYQKKNRKDATLEVVIFNYEREVSRRTDGSD